jgi:hypothetical protein
MDEAGTGPQMRRAVLTSRDPQHVIRLIPDALSPEQEVAA